MSQSGVTLAQITKNVRLRTAQNIKIRLHFKPGAGTASGTFFPYLSATLGSVTQSAVGLSQFMI